MEKKILRLPDVKTATGLSRSTIYLGIAAGTFPKSISLGDRAVGWIQEEVNLWIENKIKNSRHENGEGGK